MAPASRRRVCCLRRRIRLPARRRRYQTGAVVSGFDSFLSFLFCLANLGEASGFMFSNTFRKATDWKPVILLMRFSCGCSGLLLSLTGAIIRGYHPHGAAPGWEAALPSLHLPVTRKITRAYPVSARQEP